jgi:phosphatidylglycerophosphate synthase
LNTPSLEPASRRPLKSRDVAFFRTLAGSLVRAGVSPNAISAASMVFGAAAGLTLAATAGVSSGEARFWWLASAAFIQLRLAANLLDGLVAVEGRRGGPTGDIWNEAPDRVSDAATLIGAGFAAASSPILGFGAALMAFFVAYVRALGASAGAGQCFLGPQAKPHRMALLTLACVLSAVWPAAAFGPRAFSFVTLALSVVIVGGAVTAIRRLAFIAGFLRARGSG